MDEIAPEEKEKEETNNIDKKDTDTTLTLDFYKVIFIYLLGGLIGTLWETILNLVLKGKFVYCSGTIFTPFNFVYGIGAVAISVCLKNFKKVWQVFIVGALVGGVTEYILSFLEEKILGTRSWNYSTYPLNINGRTTIPYCLFWGLLCVVVVFLLYKPIIRLANRFPQKIFHIIILVLLVIVIVDMVFSLGAMFRYVQRAAGTPANDPISQFFDTYFNDDFMRVRFPGMKLPQKK